MQSVAKVPLRSTRRVAAITTRAKVVKEDPVKTRAERAYAALMLAEEVLSASVSVTIAKAKKGAKARRLVSASQVLDWGREMGWVE